MNVLYDGNPFMEKRVLLCDDDTGICDVLSYIFTSHEYRVKSLSHGKTILSEVELFQPHIILLDIMLPGSRGDELAREIQKQFSIPIYFVSGVENIAEIAKSTNVSGFIKKPFEIEDIEALIL